MKYHATYCQLSTIFSWIASLCFVASLGCNDPKPASIVAESSNTPVASTSHQKTLPTSDPASVEGADGHSQNSEASSEASSTSSADNADQASEPTASQLPPQPTQSWSVQRVFALAETGPIAIDISVNMGGKSLEEACALAIARVVAHIGPDLEKPWTWEKLLDHPLVRSGWLGNLVPQVDQRNQLITMYNADGDIEVDDNELPVFLTRGLARGAALRFSDIGSAPGANVRASPWDQLDLNKDSSLDKAEIAGIHRAVAKLDLNADRILTVQELQAGRAMPMDMQAPSTNFGVKSTLAMATAKEGAVRIGHELLNHYTLLDSVSRELWTGWSDALWSELDTRADGQLNETELEQLASCQPQLHLSIKFQANDEAGLMLKAQAGPYCDLNWTPHLNTSGQASGQCFAVTVAVIDSYTAANRNNLRSQLSAAMTNPQIAAGFRAQLQLSDNAFEVLDADQDQKLSDEEFEHAWDWLTAIRGSRVLARWMYAESPWFRLADSDANGRLTELEMSKFITNVASFDKDQDGSITPQEMPLVARLEIARTDERLTFNDAGSADPAQPEIGWFTASDSNGDGFLSQAEFLGSSDDFIFYDSDNDGFISKLETFKAPSINIQWEGF